MRLFFFAHLAPEERKAIALRHLHSIEQMSAQLDAARPEIGTRADRFQFLCYEFGIRMFHDMASNLGDIINALEEERTEDAQ